MRRLCVFLSWLYVGIQIAILGILTHLLSTPLGFLFLFQSELSKGWNWTGIEGQSSHHLRWSEISQKTPYGQWEAKDLDLQFDLSQLRSKQKNSKLKIIKLHAQSIVLSQTSSWKDAFRTTLQESVENLTLAERSAPKSVLSHIFPEPKVNFVVDQLQIDELRLNDLGLLKKVQLQGIHWGLAGFSVDSFRAESPGGWISGRELKWDSSKDELHFGRGLELSTTDPASSSAPPSLRVLGRLSPDTIFMDFEFWKGKIELSRNGDLLSVKAKGLEVPASDSWPELKQVHFSVFNLKDWNQNPDELHFDWSGQTWSLDSIQQNLVLKSATLPQSELRLARGLKKFLSPWSQALSANLGAERLPASQESWGVLSRAPHDWAHSSSSWIRVDAPAPKAVPLKRRKR